MVEDQQSQPVTVETLIDRMQYQKNLPAVSQHIIAINSKAVPSSNSSANDLAALILKDYSLSSRLLKVANSAMFGEFSGNISTVSRAVVVLGFEQVHLTATGLIFFEHLQDKSAAHYIKEGIISSFLSGILARDLAKVSKIDNLEHYFVGAMLHNFGRLLAMYYFPDKYQNYMSSVEQGTSEPQAMLKEIGTRFSALGIGVAKAWALPATLIESMTVPSEDELRQKHNKITHHQGISSFANELCDITMNVSPAERLQHLVVVLDKYRELYPIDQETIVAMMDSALIEMQNFSDVIRLDRDDLKKLDQRSFNATAEDDEASEQSRQDENRTTLDKLHIADTAIAHLTNSATPEERQQNLMSGIQEITNVMLEDVTLDEILTMILETIYRGIGFDQVVIFFKDPKSDQMNVRFSLGSSIKNLLNDFSFTVDESGHDLFSSSVMEGRDLYITNISDTEIRDLKPQWFRGAIFSPSFVLYPISVKKKCIGLIYAGNSESGDHLDSQQLNSIKTLRNQAALAIKQSFMGTL